MSFGLQQLLLWTMAGVLAVSAAFLLSRRGRRGSGFAAMLVGNLVLVGCALYLPQGAELLFYLSVGVFCVLVVVPSMLVIVTRRAVSSGNMRAALKLVGIRQHLQPGMGLEQERQLLESLELVQQGRTQEAVDAVRAKLEGPRVEGSVRLALLDRLLTLYVYDRRMAEAITLFEAEGGLALAAASARICAAMVRAYVEVDAFDEAASCQRLLEQGPVANDPAAAALVNGARLAFLSHLGCVEQVDALLHAPGFLPDLRGAQRELWRGLCLARAGRLEQARRLWQGLANAPTEDRGRDAARERLSQPDPTEVPEELRERVRPLVDEVAHRALAYRAVPHGHGRLLKIAPVSAALLVAIVAVYVAKLAGASGDVGDEGWQLLRLGANFPAVSLSTQPWRLVTSLFVHGGPYHLHIIFNAYALYLLGRLTEQMFGSLRFWNIYMLSGIAGSLTSAIWGRGLLSIGASGAIFGLLGAALVGLVALRGQVPEGWRRQLFVNLVVVMGLQLVIGFRVPVIDNAAHIGGVLGGMVAAIVVGSGRRRRAWQRALNLVLAAGLLGITSVSAVMGATSGDEAFLRQVPLRRVSRAGVVVRVPSYWVLLEKRGGLAMQDPLLMPSPTFQVLPPDPTPDFSGSDRQIVRLQDQLIYERLLGLNNVSRVQRQTTGPVQIRTGLLRSAMRLEVESRVMHQLNYFKLLDGAVLTMFARVPDSRLALYQPLLDRIAASALQVGQGQDSP